MSKAAGGTAATEPVPGRRYDAALHLLDRQIVDSDGSMVAKADELEFAERDDGSLALTALLTGPGVLGPRLGGRLGQWVQAIWHRLHPAEQPSPGRIPVVDIDYVDSAVHLTRPRADLGLDGFERWVDAHVVSRLPGARDHGAARAEESVAPPAQSRASRPHRLVELLGADVVGADGSFLGHVNDLRLAPTADVRGRFDALVVEGLIVDGRHAGSLLGYDRNTEQGPWLVRAAVRRLHRHAGYLPWTAVESIDWRARRSVTNAQLRRPLTGPNVAP